MTDIYQNFNENKLIISLTFFILFSQIINTTMQLLIV